MGELPKAESVAVAPRSLQNFFNNCIFFSETGRIHGDGLLSYLSSMIITEARRNMGAYMKRN